MTQMIFFSTKNSESQFQESEIKETFLLRLIDYEKNIQINFSLISERNLWEQLATNFKWNHFCKSDEYFVKLFSMSFHCLSWFSFQKEKFAGLDVSNWNGWKDFWKQTPM